MISRPEPEVYLTPVHEAVNWREQPISVRVYVNDTNSVVVKLTPTEAGQLAAKLLVTGSQIAIQLDAEAGTP